MIEILYMLVYNSQIIKNNFDLNFSISFLKKLMFYIDIDNKII